MKTNIKMRVTPEQSRRVQEICFGNNVVWNSSIEPKLCKFLESSCLYIGNKYITHSFEDNVYFNFHSYQEIDADLFIRTNGTCEENKYTMIDTIIHKPYNVAILEQKLKKKNEILKKARIKRKNQREELKLNIKLQKCISSEEHIKVLNWHIERNESLFAEIHNLKAENIEMGKLANLNRSALDLAMKEIKELNKQIEKINKDNVNYLSNNILSRDKEIEKLKAIIEYLESKVK